MDPFRMDPLTYAEYMKVQGNQDFKNGCYSMAIKKYDEAIGALTFLCQMGSDSNRDMAVLLCNRSNAFYNLNKWEEALQSARESLQFDATYIKGYYRAGYSLIKLSRTLDAARTFQQGLSILLYPSFRIPESSALIADFLIGIFSTVNNERVITPQFLLVCKNAVSGNFSAAIWQQVVEKLAKKGLWQVITFLRIDLTKRDLHGSAAFVCKEKWLSQIHPYVVAIISCLLLSTEKDRLPRSLRVNNLSLKDLFEKYVFFGNYERMERVPKLVEWLISIGASIKSVGTCPLHAVIKLCIKAKGNHLFRWLLDRTPELKDLINQQNEDGSTVLHIVASQTSGYSWNNQMDDLMMLLNAGVDPGICDAQLRTAVDILKKNKKFRAVDAINKHIAKSMPRSEESQVTEETESGASDVLNTALLQDAFEKFVGFCHLENEAHNTNLLKNGKTQRLVKLLSSVRDIPDEITCDIPPACARNFIKLLLEKQLWHQVLLLLTRTTTGQMTPGNALIKSCDLSDLDIGVVLQCIDKSTKQRVQLLKCLIDRGASLEGTGTMHEKPLQKCLKNNDFEMARFLLNSGADPRCISFVEGDTPLHAAVSICFDKNDNIGLCFLSDLLNLYVSNPPAFPYLNPNSQNKNGDTILHIIFQKNLTKQVKKMLSLLAKFDINCNLKNNSGRDVFYKRKKNDPVRVAWNEAVGENKKKFRHDGAYHLAKMPKPPPNGDKSQSRNSTKLSSAPSSILLSGKQPADVEAKGCEGSWDEEEGAGVKNSEFHFNKSTVREYLVQEIAQLIQKLALCEVSPRINSVTPSSFEAKVEDEKGIQQPICDGERLAYNGENTAFLHKEKVLDEYQGSEDQGEEPVEEDEQLQEIEACTQEFENMTWEIECTSKMLKKLGSKSVSSKMKKKIVFVVQQLGNGEWTQSLQKQLKHSESNIQLYEAKLNKGARMLWEIAIEFSPRCSENAEKIIEDEHSTHPANKTGRVYTEIIRIWDIVLDHEKLDHAIENICTSYNRGLSCVLRKKLKGINLAPMSSNLKTQKRIPRIYVEDTRAEKPKDNVTPEYFPPASAVETEYNIMKFHSFSTNMALNIVNDMTSAVEYPFRVGELEYAVIDLNPKPLEPIILIGRSGTGKTTCCLYRLWKKFHSYWERAEMAQGPLLVRQKWRTLKFVMQLENKRKEPTAEELDCSDSVDSGELETSVSTDDEQGQLEDEQYDSSLEDLETTSVNEFEETEESTVEDCDKLEHLHQIFVTKNHVLCQEVQKNFIELSKSSKPTSHFKPLEVNIYRLQDVKDENFPLFLTSQQLLLLLDASMPEPFFLRNEDGSLKRTIAGWSTKEDLVISNWHEEEDDVDVEVDYDEEEKVEEVQEKECDPRTFITYSIFANKFWPQMIKGKCPYNPALVWKEIKSFLKGSFEALNSPQGILTEEEYKKLGRKRSPNFKEDRSEIYQLFLRYQQIRSQGGYFDEEDVLYKLSQRLSKLSDLPWFIHELYGDEIQDFTQAELVLLMKCIDNPNAMFLTGDTAQSIMKGVAFRFSDLKSLFHYASKSSTDKKQCIVRKPKRIYQLYQNYRSHSGILRLASGVVDLLQYYFPESFDRLPRDSGLFDGPKPTVLESCSVSDLAILLKGNKRKTQPIEFGAHQVILVANEMAKEKIPEELNLALVLTIYEAKGLEFDDVLLYNFFTDSEAYKEWKIISSFVPPSHLPADTKLIIEAPLEKDLDSQGKVLNPELYKMLNGELKHLYTAITRARVNLWIFDENEDKRAPAFQYFVKQKLVQVVKKDEDFDDSMFVKTSTPEEWIAQGEYYAKHQCWKVAAKCYQKGGEIKKEKLALAHDAVLKVQTKKISPKEKQKEYMDLAKTYLKYGEPNLALKCLMKVKEYQLCAQLCEKLGKVKEAAYLYKRSHCFKDASRCFEQIQEFDLALKMCYQAECYEEAAKAVERYEKILRKDGQLTSKLSYTASQFYLEAAANYRSTGKISQMMEMLSHLDTEDQLVFLKTHKYFHEAADLLKSDGRNEEAAKLMKQQGFVLEAAKLTNQKDFRASCLLAVARLHSASLEKLENGRVILKEAIELYEETNQKSGGAEATYLMGILDKDFKALRKAFYMFLEVNHNAGAVEALFQAIRCEEESETILNITSYGIEALLNLVKAFKKAYSNAQREMVKSCFEYFGIVQIDKETCQVSQNEAGCILEFGNSSAREKKTSDQFIVGLEEVKFALNKHLLNRLNDITCHLHQLNFPNICLKFIAGLKCEDEACGDFHRVLSRHEIKSIFHCKMHLAAINGLLLEAKQLFPKDLLHEPNAIDDMLTADKYALCKSLIDVLFPKHFHLRMVSNNPVAFKQILCCSHRTFKLCRIVLREYIRFQFNIESARNRRESTDLWLRTMQVFAWTRSYPEEFERLLFTEEDEFDREQKLLVGRSKGIEGRYGMLIPDKYSENLESTHLCFIRLLQYSLDQLYVHRNLEECKFLFFRFMNVLVMKCVDPLIPSIGNTVALLEFQFILYCTVLMRLCKNMTLCLPKSYIALLQYWEFLFRRNDQYRDVTFSIIQEYRPEDVRRAINKFKFHLKYLADVLCGYEQFNVLLDAFDDHDFIVSGEAERTVVLCLVMLVNADQVLSYKYKDVLTVHFPTIREILLRMRKECPSKVPERLLKIVNLMSEPSDVKTVVTGLKELLFCRDEEYLADCCWRWDPKAPRSYWDGNNKGVRGIYYQDVDLDRFVYLNQAEYFEDPEIDFENDIYIEERKDPLANIASIRRQKQQQKAFAKRKLECLFLFVCFWVRWKKMSCSKPEPAEAALGIFKRADVDPTQCDLCGVKFLQRSETFIAQAEDSEKDPMESTAPTDTDWEENVETNENENAATVITYDSHVILDEHKKKYACYLKYYEFFQTKVEPLIHHGKNMIENISENILIKGHFASNEQSNLHQRKIQEAIKKISDTVEDVYKRKAWADGEEILLKLASKLNSNLVNASAWLKNTESHLQKEEEFDHDNDLDNNVKGEEVTFEELHHKKPSRRNGRRR